MESSPFCGVRGFINEINRLYRSYRKLQCPGSFIGRITVINMVYLYIFNQLFMYLLRKTEGNPDDDLIKKKKKSILQISIFVTC